MGSTGSGSFSDYSQQKPNNPGDSSGGTGGVDNCLVAFSTALEDVGRCDYYINNSDVPQSDTEVVINFNGVRLVAETATGEELGYLPTKYNYIRFCMNEGHIYSGVVAYSALVPSPTIRIDIVPA
jgi:hypothetical protein